MVSQSSADIILNLNTQGDAYGDQVILEKWSEIKNPFVLRRRKDTFFWYEVNETIVRISSTEGLYDVASINAQQEENIVEQLSRPKLSVAHRRDTFSPSEVNDPLVQISSIKGLSSTAGINAQQIDNIVEQLSRPKPPESIAMVIHWLDSLRYPKCARRIEFLKNYDDFEEGEEPLSLESAQSFLSFMSSANFRKRFSRLGEPALGLSADGILGADWRIADNKHLLVEFHHGSMVSFAMIGPNPDSPEDGKFRLNGRNTREEVIKTLYKQGVTDW